MSLATRCTACGTVFRVVQDQLKVSEGWVRCGRCQQVFNALEALFDLEREAPPPRPAPPPVSPGAAGVTEFVSSLLPPADPDEPLPETQAEDAVESRFLAPPPAPARRAHEPPEFADARFPSELPLDDDAPAPPPSTAEIEAEIEAEVEPEPAPAPRPQPLLERWRSRRDARRAAAAAPPPAVDAPGDEADDDISVFDTEFLPGDESPRRGEALAAANDGDDASAFATMRELVAPPPPAGPMPTFVRAAERAERWQRPRVRASLAVAALLLLGTLAAQVAVQFRDAFAARWPEARPALETLCEALGCEIGPLRRLAAISVAGSGLAPSAAPDGYRLSLTLANRDAVALATPSVELSLSDSRGRLVARRVLAPGELRRVPDGSPLGTSLGAGSETQVSVAFTLRERAVSGYTVELFYP